MAAIFMSHDKDLAGWLEMAVRRVQVSGRTGFGGMRRE